MKRSYLIPIVLLVTGAIAYFVYSAAKDQKPAGSGNMMTSGQLKQPDKTSSGKINPPHGQSGHRCDIADGAPLPDPGTSSAPIPALNPIVNNPVISKPPVQAPALPVSQTGTAAEPALKINPAHGEPGHRCDIKTGDPLPAPGSGTAAPKAAPSKSISATPAVPAGAKVNPPHGQPGHRCDIQVGAALPAG